MYTCSECHETTITNMKGELIIITFDVLTGRITTVHWPADEEELEALKEKLQDGECPVCDGWTK